MFLILSSQRSRGPSALPTGLRGNPAPPTPRSLGGAHAWVEGQDCIEGGLCGMVDRWESPVSALPLGCQHSQRVPLWTLALSGIATTALSHRPLLFPGLHLSRSPQMSCAHTPMHLIDHSNPCPHECNQCDAGPSWVLRHLVPLLPLHTLSLHLERCWSHFHRWTRIDTRCPSVRKCVCPLHPMPTIARSFVPVVPCRVSCMQFLYFSTMGRCLMLTVSRSPFR